MTEQELMAAIAARRRMPTTLNSYAGPTPASTQPLALGNSAEVDAAYQAMMAYNAQADEDTGSLRRNLSNALDLSGKNRLHTILNSHQQFADRGTLNSGLALNQDTNLNTTYDSNDQSYNNAFQDNLSGIARHKLALSQGYQNAQVSASEKATAARAASDAAAIAQQQQVAIAQTNQAALLAQLQQLQAPTAIPDQAPQIMADPGFTPAPVQHVYAPTKPRAPVVRAPIIKSPIPKLLLRGRY